VAEPSVPIAPLSTSIRHPVPGSYRISSQYASTNPGSLATDQSIVTTISVCRGSVGPEQADAAPRPASAAIMNLRIVSLLPRSNLENW